MIKLLLVEDDVNLCYIVQAGLQDVIGGYEVITAGNGLEGLHAWEEHKPDIIISDIDMPEMDGFEMVRRIRETDGDTPIPVCFRHDIAQRRETRLRTGREQLREEAFRPGRDGRAHPRHTENEGRRQKQVGRGALQVQPLHARHRTCHPA